MDGPIETEALQEKLTINTENMISNLPINQPIYKFQIT